ncbi:MinD/ParA family ATP-binding protein [Actinoallomurus iriomotensis]|uniref:CobQ/CobB/MinD/ParA nucleotide binding domain-containing protein n=1 Tax=Actinoallomurus iriomotensis TaxID=478107 RepID=A0A9W6SH64_9ACTN|nr:MinD/ParA family protein [Actinoallomurus iriomotensis]GLY92142.1 hypothetical protein Airi02_100700 [Actinoallomurus iriomotensis]
MTDVTPTARTSSDWQTEVLNELGAGGDGLAVLADRPTAPARPREPAAPRPAPRPPAAEVPPTPAVPAPRRPPPAYGTAQPPPSARRPDLTRPDGHPVAGAVPKPPPPPPPYGAPPAPGSDDALTGRPVHGDPMLRRVTRGIQRVVGASTTSETHDRTAAAGRLQQAVTTTRRIAVTSLRGGAGKTTIAVLTASALARHRPDRVLLIDADPEFGTMPLRLGVTSAPALPELAGRRFEWFDDVRPYLARTDAGLWILPGTGSGTATLDPGVFQTVTGALNRFFAIVVIDCGAGLTGELQRGVLANAHAHIHVTPGTADGAVSAGRALDWLNANGHQALAPRTVTVFATHAPHSRANLAPATALLRSHGIGVAHLPYDRHLASGGVLDLSLLAESTRQAAIEIGAEALTRARS